MSRSRTLRKGRGDEGAALVEFALIMPLLFLLIFGIIEFGWAFGQYLDVRHGSREASRLVAVNYQAAPGQTGATQSGAIVTEVCDRLSSADGARVTMSLESSLGTDDGRRAVGQPARVVVERDLDTLTGFLDFALGGIVLESSAGTRIEQRATWEDNFTNAPNGCP